MFYHADLSFHLIKWQTLYRIITFKNTLIPRQNNHMEITPKKKEIKIQTSSLFVIATIICASQCVAGMAFA